MFNKGGEKMIFENLKQMIGNTPLFHAKKYCEDHDLNAQLFAKLEWYNPSGSVKDRIASAILDGYKNEGKLNDETIIIEPTSGNTGIGLAALCCQEHRKLILTMPETMSEERKRLLKVYGAELVLTDGKKGMKGAIQKAHEIHSKNPNSLIFGQFESLYNPQAHYEHTGKEIYEDLNGNIDIFLAGIGTGGTIMGVGKYLKEKNKNIKIIGVEPETSPIFTKGFSGKHIIQGIGAGFIPPLYDAAYVDEIIDIKEENAIQNMKEFVKSEGLLIGLSSAANLEAFHILSAREENKGKVICTIFPDNGMKYLSMNLF